MIKTYVITIKSPEGPNKVFTTTCKFFYQAVQAAEDFLKCVNHGEITAIISTSEYDIELDHTQEDA